MGNLWLIVACILLIVELISHNIVTMWYAIGAILAFLASIHFDNYSIELGVFILVGTILTIILRPVLNNYLKEKLKKIRFLKK